MTGRVRARGRLYEGCVVLLGSLVLAIAVTWPTAIRIGRETTGGGLGGDPLGYLWDIWYSATNGVDWWGPGNQMSIGAPFGRPINAGANLLLIVSVGPSWVLAKTFSPIVAYNVNIITALTLTAGSMYLLIRWLRLGRLVATWSAVAYTLFPYELLRASAHPPLAHLWCFPLVVLLGLRWVERASWGRGVSLALGLVLCWLTNPYYGVMGSVIVGLVILLGLGADRRVGLRVTIRRLFTIAVPSLGLVLLPLVVASRASGRSVEVLRRSAIEIELYGARFTDYVRPPGGDPVANGFGVNPKWLGPGGERMNFLGWGTLPLFVLGGVLLLKNRRRLGRRIGLAAILAIGLVALGLLFSLASPYTLAGHRFTTPAGLIFDVLPYLRVYARFVVVVTVGAIIVGAAGLYLVSLGRSVGTRVNVAALAILASFAVLPIGGPLAAGVPGLIDGVPTQKRPTWVWLSQHPHGIVLETPAFPNESLDRLFMYGQTVHGHSLANGSLAEPNRATDFLVSLGNDGRLDGSGVAERLRTIGVTYVAIEPWAYNRVGLTAPNAANPPRGYALEAVFPDGSGIWRVTAPARVGVAIFQRGAWWDPVDDQGVIWRPTRDHGRTTIYVPQAGRFVLKFGLRTARKGVTNNVHATGPGGLDVTLTAGDEVVPVELAVELPAGESTIALDNVGALASAPAPGDPRLVSVETTGWSVLRAP